VHLFRERCLGATHESVIAAAYHFYCLNFMGELRIQLRETLRLVREAEERGDHFTLTSLHGSSLYLMISQDQPEAARQEVERTMALLTTGGSDVRRLLGQLSRADIELYQGDGVAAYQRLDQDWGRWLALPVTRLAITQARALSLHGRAALAACRSSGPDRRLVRAAMRDARGLRAIRLPWTGVLARILDAGVALVTGARERGREQLERAHAELAGAGMTLHAAVARRRLGELAGGAEGAHVIAEVDALLAAQDIRAPERFARLYMPEVT
jgi:hypothetical protein